MKPKLKILLAPIWMRKPEKTSVVWLQLKRCNGARILPEPFGSVNVRTEDSEAVAAQMRRRTDSVIPPVT